MEGKIFFFFIAAMILAAAMENSQGHEYYSNTIPASHLKEKVTHLHFFLHDIVSGENATVAQIARPSQNDTGLGAFGALYAVNDAIRVGIESSSKLIGRAKGLYVAASQKDEFQLVLYLDFGFIAGKFNGSSFVVCSRNPVLQTEREVAVVGGRGRFRLARGIAKLHTRYLNFTSGDAIIEYNVTLFHY
ncbi:dirigent protein 4 [Manihot esculenta]|uniref:Dirigent protein n=1 Tax=Manihot esculenta TaxID=3983 RepID=A0A2C9UF56_MANES|nr:dirigent protein 4 [Manihot esculenta]OAY28994.1 hypothetical protein MANES_15G109700v8 [Manihot esculenta]